MNEEALQQLYTLAKGEGYGDSYEDFKVLMSQNEKAVGDMFSLARAEGYRDERSDFDVLVGYSPLAASEQEVITEEGVVETDQSMRPDLKKKDVTESVSADGLSEQQKTTDFLDYSQMVSSPIMQDAATRPLVAEEDVPTTTEELTQTLSTAQRQGGQRFFEIDGEYVDLLHPDGDKRRENLDRYQAFLNQQEQQEAQRLKEEAEAMTAKVVGYDKFTGRPIYESKGMPLIKFDAKEEKEKREAQKKKISKIKRFTEGDKEKYDSYNPLVNASSTPLKVSQQKGYLPGNVESIPKAADIVSGRMKPVVPFDMEAYRRDEKLYAMMYDAEVETYKDYLKDKADYVRAADGRYYNPENFNAGEIFNNKINKLVNQELIEKEEEAVSMMLSDELSPFGFKVDKTGTFTDRIIVTAPNGQRQEFSLNNFFDDTDFNESVRLKAFLKRQYAKELTGGNIPRDIYGKELSLLDIDVSPQQNADIIDKLTSSERRALNLDRERTVAGQGQLIYESDKEINNLNAQLEDTNKKIAEAEKLPESYKEWRGNTEVTVKNQERADRLQFLNKKKSALEKKIDDASFENRRLKKDKPINPVYKEFFSDNLDAQIQTDTEVLNEENRRHIYLVDLFKEKEDAFLEAEKQALALAEQSFDKKTQTWKSEEAERDYNKLTNVLENEKILLNKYGEKLLNEDIRLKIKDEQLTRDVGRKAAIQAEIGELGDSIVSAIVSGAGAVIEGGTEEFAGNIIRNINNMFYDETDEEYITDEEMNDLKKQSSIKKDWVDSYGSWADLTPEAMQAFRESLGVVSQGFYGALESSPSMLLSLIPGGRVLAPLGFSFLSAQNLREQMDNNPDFDYMSENDKLKFIAPMAFSIGLLENYGVRNVMRNSSFLGKTAAKLAGKGPTSKTLNEISDDLGKNYFQREVRKYVTTGLGELETEAMQEALDIYGKEYMDLKMKNNFWDQDVRFFKDEKGDVNYFSKAALSQIIESGMAGFFGGLTMKAPSTIANAVKGNKVEEIDDFTFMFYEAGMESPTIANAQRAQINNDIASGKITKEQGDDMWNTYTRTVGQMREVKKVAGQYDTNTKKKLLSLLMEKKQLEEKIDGVDKSLTREEQRKIKVAEERIQETLASGETKLTEGKAAYEQAKKDGYKGTFEQHRNNVKIKEVAEQAVEQEVKKKKPVKKAPIKEEKPVEAPAVEETTEEPPVTEEERAKMREVLGEPAAQAISEDVVEETTPTKTTQEVEVVQGNDVVTNKSITINYNRNPESAPDMGTQFGQDVEAAGIYITQKQGDFTPAGFETGTVTINNPLVIDVSADTQIEYKRKLSEENDGKTGVELSNALKEKGFDAIVTKNEDGSTGEIVLLNDILATEELVEEATVVEEAAPVKEAPIKKTPKKTTKKKAPVKEEPQVSEQVQKEIDRAERLRDRIVAEKANKLSKAKGFEQKEEIRDEIRQAEKKYNNIITELKEGKRTQFQVKETQETKTDASRYQQFVSVLKRSFPSVEVVTTQAEFDALLEETGAIELTTKDQSVYGAVYQGKLYLNPSLENYNTPIHEFGHVWMNVAKEANRKLYEKGLSLVKNSKYRQDVLNNKAYQKVIKQMKKDGASEQEIEQYILEEALATAIGDKGESFVNASQKKNFKQWLETLYGFVRKLTGISKYSAKQLEDITLDEFTQAVAVDLLSGEQLFEGAEITDMGDALQLMAEKANIKPSMSAQNIIKKARAAEEPIRDAVIIDYLMSEKKLTRKQAISALKRANRGDLKDAVKRLFNNVEDITDIKEKDAQLIKDILKFDRSITRADKIAQKKIKDEIKIRLKAIQRKSKGKLSQAQLLAVTNRFANVNLSSEKSIDSFVDYMQKVFSDVDYAAKMTSLNKSITDAKTNINSKIGRGADGLASELRMLLNISPTIIPDSVFEEYSDLVTSFGARKTVLKLKDSVEVKETIAKIFTELENQNSKLGELTERFEAFDDKKFTKTGAVSFSETVAQMVKDKVITEDEAKLMRKFKSDIMPIEKAEGKTEEDKEKEMEEEKKILIENIKKSPVDVKRIPVKEMRDEYNLAKQFSELIKTNALNELNNAQLKNIQKAIDNINNGYVTHYIQLAKENLDSINKKNIGGEAIQEAKPLKTSKKIAQAKAALEKGANVYYKMIERNPLINIDAVLGDMSSKRIFNSVLEESAEAITKFNTEIKKVNEKIEKAEVMLQNKFKKNGNKILKSKYKQMAYMVQQEFEANPNNPQVNPAAAVMKETIKKLNDTNQTYEAQLLEEILDEFSIREGENKGEIDLKKLDDSFVFAELNMIKTVQDINAELTDKAVYTSAVLRGEAIQPLNSYVHQSVLNDKGAAIDDSKALSDSYMENIRPSTKAKNLIERTKGAKPINFDITSSVRRGAKMTLMDYHLTSAFRTANRTLNKMEDVVDNTGDKRQIYLGVRDAYNQAIADVLEVNFSTSSVAEQVLQYTAKQGYRTMLAGGPRAFVELASNYAFALNNPTEMLAGMQGNTRRISFSEKGAEVMNNVGSKQTERVFGERLSGRLIDPYNVQQRMGMSADSAKNPVINRLTQGLSYLKSVPGGVETVADFLITTPDKLVTRPMWFGSFATEFKKITKEEVNFDKIAENDAEYMEKFEKAINEAKRKADDNTVIIGATDNPLMGILKNKKRLSDSVVQTAFKTINTFMQRFLLFEYNAFRKGMYAAMGSGEISRLQGLKLMGAVAARMTLYTSLMPIMTSLMMQAFGYDDDDDESIYRKIYRNMLTTATTLFIGRDFGGVIKIAQNFIIEKANEKYGEDLGIRDGAYDPFKNSVQFNIVPPNKPYKDTEIWDVVPNLAGPYSPLIKTIALTFNTLHGKEKETEEAKERRRRTIEERIPLEIFGVMGLIPFYKDLRRVLLKDIYKDLDKSSKGESESKSSSSKSDRKGRKGRSSSKRRKRKQR